MCFKMDRYTFRQIFILVSGSLTSFSTGITLAFPSVLNPSILSTNSTIPTTSSEASWIAASHGITGILGFFIFSPLFQILGRKYVNLMLCIVQLVGWIIFIFADSILDLLAARLIQGFVMGNFFISAVTVAEYCDPKRRGYFMAIKKIALSVGSLACHSLALFMDWRQISLFSCVPLVISGIAILMWPESPAFLALKGKFDECEKSFKWANGNSVRAQQQLNELIDSQSQRLSKVANSVNKICIPRKLLKTFFSKEFLRPLFITTILSIAIDASGRFFLLTYITQILVDVTGDSSLAMYCAVGSDLLIVSALSTSCIIIRLLKRRTILFSLGSIEACLMFVISLVLVAKTHFHVGTDVSWLVPTIILIHGFVSHVGLIAVSFAIMAEVFPLEHKGLGCFASGIVFASFYTLTVKLTPPMIEYTGVSGTYAIYGLCVVLCLILLYFILPETKDRTLQEIEDEIKGVKNTHENAVLIGKFDGLRSNGDKRNT